MSRRRHYTKIPGTNLAVLNPRPPRPQRPPASPIVPLSKVPNLAKLIRMAALGDPSQPLKLEYTYTRTTIKWRRR